MPDHNRTRSTVRQLRPQLRPGRPPRQPRPVTRLRLLRHPVGDAGMATAEYAIGLLAATGFALLLLAILHGSAVKGLLTGIVTKALSVG